MTINSVPRQIFAMGGGGFSMEPENLLLDKYILGLSQKERPKVCFVPTASGDSDRYIVRFYSTYVNLPCQPSHLSLFFGHALQKCGISSNVIPSPLDARRDLHARAAVVPLHECRHIQLK